MLLSGPISYENWIASKKENMLLYCHEFPLFTDSHIVGEISDGYGPYKFLNTVPVYMQEGATPSIILRIDEYLEYHPPQSTQLKTDVIKYHGGWFVDEIAALMSLNLGIRLKAGGSSRRFDIDGDPKGHPEMHYSHWNPIIVKNPLYRLMIPSAVENHCLNDAALLRDYYKLSPSNAIAIVKAARLYQDALWISELQPDLSWIIFVSSIETAANQWRTKKESSLERLRSLKPDLVEKLAQIDGSLPNMVATQISEYLGSTQKFIDFILTFFPEPPSKRPPAGGQIPWEKESLEVSLRKIYDWRSKALHGGTPFPEPMCNPPLHFNNFYFEKPPGLAVQSKGATWNSDDTPMCLHVFEHLVRRSLQNWWASMNS
jgi:hypothetical protein